MRQTWNLNSIFKCWINKAIRAYGPLPQLTSTVWYKFSQMSKYSSSVYWYLAIESLLEAVERPIYNLCWIGYKCLLFIINYGKVFSMTDTGKQHKNVYHACGFNHVCILYNLRYIYMYIIQVHIFHCSASKTDPNNCEVQTLLCFKHTLKSLKSSGLCLYTKDLLSCTVDFLRKRK